MLQRPTQPDRPAGPPPSDPAALPAVPTVPFRALAPALFVLLLAVYTATLLPGVGYQADTARFQFVPRVLGIPHQTGFPAYLLLNRLFVALLPSGSVAWRANLLSAVFSALAGIALLRLLLEIGDGGVRSGAAFAAALAFGLTRTLWSQSVVAEVYTLNLLFTALVLLYFLRWARSGRFRDFALATALYALSFGNHLLMVTLLPAIVWWVWRTDRRAFRDPRKIAWALAWIALGAAQYGYLLWRTREPTTLYLEHQVGDLGRLWWYVSGGPARGRMLAFSASELISERLPMLGRLLWQNFGPLLAVCGLGVATLGRRPENRFLLLALGGPLAFALGYDIPDVFVYFLPVYLVLAVYLGVGLDRLASRAFLLAVIPLALLAANWREVDQSGNTARAEEIETALTTADRNAVLLAPSRAYSRLVYYYLLAGGWEDRNLHVAWAPDRALAYLRGQPLYLPEQRREVAPGLPVYAIGPARRGLLESAGLRPVEIRRWRTVLYLAAADPGTQAAALAALQRRALAGSGVPSRPGPATSYGARPAIVRFEPAIPRLTLFEPDALPRPEGLRPGPVTTDCAIEDVEGRWAGRRPVRVAAPDGFLSLRGWALDGKGDDRWPAGGVYAILDGGHPLPTTYGQHRAPTPDLACRRCESRGFEALFPLDGLPPGRHQLSLAVLSRDRREIRPCARRVHLDLKP
jgi:transmembrane protein TMEM260 (protein O-mannosyltransferase)